MLKYVLSPLTFVMLTSAASASVVQESSVGEFSNDPTAPYIVAAGTQTVLGTGDADVFDFLRFDGLADGAQNQEQFGLTWKPNATISLDPSFSGSLYVGLYFNSGTDIGYTITLPTQILAVPLPASGLLMLAGMAGLARLRRRPA